MTRSGSSHRPERAAIFAFKHQSAWETLATHLLVPGAAIVLKRELIQIPLFGWCLLHAGMIRIDRRGERARCAVCSKAAVPRWPAARRS